MLVAPDLRNVQKKKKKALETNKQVLETECYGQTITINLGLLLIFIRRNLVKIRIILSY